MTVYVVQEAPGKNLLPARKFGKIEVLLPPGQVLFDPQSTLDMLRKKMSRFTSEDFLVMIGDPVAISLAAIVAGEFSDTIKFLKWDKQERDYAVVETELGEIEP